MKLASLRSEQYKRYTGTWSLELVNSNYTKDVSGTNVSIGGLVFVKLSDSDFLVSLKLCQ